jgi:hypothetical protein
MEGEVWRLELSSMIAVPQGGVPETERHHRFIIRINRVSTIYLYSNHSFRITSHLV